MRKAGVATDVGASRLNSCVGGVETSPVSAEMTQMPLLIDEAILLMFGHLVIDELHNNAIVEINGVLPVFVAPGKAFLDATNRPEHSRDMETSRWW